MDTKVELENVKSTLRETKARGAEITAQLDVMGKKRQMLLETEVGRQLILVDEAIKALANDSLENQKEQLRLEGELRVLKRLNGAKPKKGG